MATESTQAGESFVASSGSNPANREVVPWIGANANERRLHRSQLRTMARKDGQPSPLAVAQMDPVPPVCNRAALPWGESVTAQHCQCAEFSSWFGRHGGDSNLIYAVEAAKDVNGTLWSPTDNVSYWRPGGKHLKERYWYNAVLGGLWSIRFPSGARSVVAQVN
jgi:hypothetical protein